MREHKDRVILQNIANSIFVYQLILMCSNIRLLGLDYVDQRHSGQVI